MDSWDTQRVRYKSQIVGKDAIYLEDFLDTQLRDAWLYYTSAVNNQISVLY
jgi:hypothetical protein